MTLREIFFSLGYEVDKSSESKAESSIKSLKSTATKLLGAIGIGFSLTQLNAISEEFSGINDQIRSATKNLGDQKGIQKQILAAANDTKTAYGYMADLVSDLVQGDKNLFGSVEDAAEFASLTTKVFKTAGKADAEIQSLQEVLNKSFAKGKVETETLNQLYEKAPEAINLIADSLGVAKDSLLDMAAQGTITCADLKNAFVNSADVINGEFSNLRFNISDALLNIRNQWGLWVDGMNETLGLTQTIGTTMVKGFTKFMEVLQRVQTRIGWLAEKLGGADKLLKLIALSAGALFVAFNLDKIVKGIKAMGTALGGVNKKALLIAAVIILIALLIEDFIKFMKGEDSLIGSLFEKAGIDAEAARQTILKAWEAIKGFLLKAWEVIKKVAMTIFGALSDWWAENGEAVKESFLKIWESIKKLCETLWNALKKIAETVFNALKRFWDTWGATIMEVFRIIWDTLISLIQPFLNALRAIIDFLANVFSGDWEGAWQSIKDFAAAIWEMITTIITGAWDIICNVWNKLAEIFGGIFEAAKTAISEKVTAIKDSIVDGFQAAIDWIKALPEQAIQWGKDIIDGIVNGIKNAIGKVGDAVSGVASKIKSFLGFSEPDDGPLSDFHTYMPDMIDLMAQGIESGKSKVKQALENLTGDMSVAAQANLVSGDTLSKAGIGSSSSKNITQNVEINNQFNGDRAGQEKSSNAMDKASNDATSELARAIAFAK